MLKKMIGFVAFAMATISFGAYVELAKDGGARDQGLDNAIAYSGPLNALPIIWGAATLAAVGFVWIVLRFRIKPHWTLLCLWSLSMFSSFWAEVPKASLGAALLLTAAYLLVVTHIRLLRWNGVLHAAIKCVLIFEVSSFIYIFLIPHYGLGVGEHLGKWQGIFTHKNTLGSFGALAFLISFWYYLTYKSKLGLLSTILSFALVIGSQSTTSYAIVSIVFVLNILCLFRFPRNVLYANRMCILIGLLLLSAGAVYMAITSNVDVSDEKYSSFSNRNLIWLYMFVRVATSPLWGFGLDQLSIVNSLDGSDFISGVGFLVASAHNGFIETLFSLGLFGLVTLVAVLVSFVRNMPANKAFPLLLGYIFLFILENTFESKLLSFNSCFIVLLYMIEGTKSLNAETTQALNAETTHHLARREHAVDEWGAV